ncbi:hypothetical protein MHBO_003462 [Bonamia ostreae]|uniref:50S ribosomal protein L19, chloroplastic n=1 Tax=Bonamia ostreae TaxID=126728 RepID=A0ABV2ARF8_9EUKA
MLVKNLKIKNLIHQQNVFRSIRHFASKNEKFKKNRKSDRKRAAVNKIILDLKSEQNFDDLAKLPDPLPLDIYESSDSKNTHSYVKALREGSIRGTHEKKKNPEIFKMRYEEIVPNMPGREYHKQPTPQHFMKMLNDFEIRKMENRRIENFNAGDEIEIELKKHLPDGGIEKKKGLCIARRNRGYGSSFVLRLMGSNKEAFELTYPLYSPFIVSIKMLERHYSKKKKLLFMRDKKNFYLPAQTIKK